MAVVPISMAVTIYPKNKTVAPYPATIAGYAWITGLEVGGGPVIPPEPPPIDPDAHPEHPIVLPPVTEPPPDMTPPGAKPFPPDGGWGYIPNFGWVWWPGPAGAGPKK